MRRPTIHDVAVAAGVSRGTVSRLLNGDKYVSPGARAAVQRAIAETGYVVNRAARGLVTRRAGTIVMVMAEPPSRFFEDPNYSTLTRTAVRRLAEHDMSLVMMLAGDTKEQERVVHYVRGGHADGVLLVSVHAADIPLIEKLRSGPPTVSCGAIIGHQSAIPYAAVDERLGARQMTEHLVSQGRRRIAMITGPMDTPGGVQRLEGFSDTLGRKVTKKLIAYGDWTRASGERAMTELLSRAPDIDAVFAASDLMAAGAMAALRIAGRRVPDDVAVGGFDDSSVALSTHPPLTTIRQPLAEVVSQAVLLLMALIEGSEGVEPVVLPPELVIRESTRATTTHGAISR